MLATRPQVALPAEIVEAIDRARAFAEAAKSGSIRKAYASDLRDFAAYCERIGASPLPAEPAVVATYCATISETKSVATIRRRMVAIAQAHKAADLPNPVADRRVQAVLSGIAPHEIGRADAQGCAYARPARRIRQRT